MKRLASTKRNKNTKAVPVTSSLASVYIGRGGFILKSSKGEMKDEIETTALQGRFTGRIVKK